MRAVVLLALVTLTGCSRVEPAPYYAIDGDTIAVRYGPHIRLVDIDAPELPGHCRLGRRCVPGDPYAAKNALQQFLGQGEMTCVDHGRDYYKRRLADCWMLPTSSSRFNLSQAMYSTGLVGLYERN